MTTTMQINEETLFLLKKLKMELKVNSYEEAIKRVIIERVKEDNAAGSLKKYFQKKSLKEILRENQNERRKSDRY